MRFHFRHFALAALIMGPAITTSLDAQQAGPRPPRAGAPQPGERREIIEERVITGQPGRRGLGGPAGFQRGNPAGMLLGLRTQLGLNDEQVKRLEALRDAGAPKPSTADMLRARADLLEATQGDGNLAAARAALDKMSRLRTEQMLAGLKVRQDARAVLTPAQKTKLDGMRQQMASRARKAMIGRVRGNNRRGSEAVIEQRIMRAPGGNDGGAQPPMLRRGGRPPVPPQGPASPDTVR